MSLPTDANPTYVKYIRGVLVGRIGAKKKIKGSRRARKMTYCCLRLLPNIVRGTGAAASYSSSTRHAPRARWLSACQCFHVTCVADGVAFRMGGGSGEIKQPPPSACQVCAKRMARACVCFSAETRRLVRVSEFEMRSVAVVAAAAAAAAVGPPFPLGSRHQTTAPTAYADWGKTGARIEERVSSASSRKPTS